jgi:hypothetical protein
MALIDIALPLEFPPIRDLYVTHCLVVIIYVKGNIFKCHNVLGMWL